MTLRRLLRHLFAGVVVLSLAASACSGSSDSGGSSPPTSPSSSAGLTGTWVGTASDSSGPGQMTWQLTQSGGSFTGTVAIADTATKLTGRGTVAGTVSGSSIRFRIAVPAGGFDAPYTGCAADASGEGQLNGSAISATYEGSSTCGGTIASGQMTLTKQ